MNINKFVLVSLAETCSRVCYWSKLNWYRFYQRPEPSFVKNNKTNFDVKSFLSSRVAYLHSVQRLMTAETPATSKMELFVQLLTIVTKISMLDLGRDPEYTSGNRTSYFRWPTVLRSHKKYWKTWPKPLKYTCEGVPFSKFLK